MVIVSEQYEDIIDGSGRVVGRRLVVVRDAEPAPTTTKMTHLGFLDRMQADEWARFEGLLSQSAEARFAKAKFDIARDVDVARADVQAFAATLRAVGVLLTDERVTALLAPIPVNSVHALT